MKIPTLAASFNAVRPAYTDRTNSTAFDATTASSGVKPRSDVTISSAGRHAASAEKAASTGQSTPSSTSGTPAVEMYAIPKWLADYGFEVPNTLEESGNWFAEKYPKAAAASQDVLVEYGKRLDGHLRAVLDANGIKGLDDFHDALIVNESKSEQIRQQLVGRLLSDPRMVDLMLEVGKMPA